jgi:hypothetical protein
MNEILIYVPKITNRVRYVFRLVFKDLLKISYELTNDLDAFQSADKPKMMYGMKAHTDDIFFKSSGLLFERGVHSLDYNAFDYKGDKAFFQVFDEEAVLPFDVFSAIFFLVSRYEEYLPFVRDQHGRFSAPLSVSSQWNILEKPMVNIWALEIKRIILERYPGFTFPQKKFRFIPTYDIDSAWAYQQKGLLRNLGGYYMSFKSLDFSEIALRTRVLTGKEKDPFDTFDLQLSYQKKYNLHPVYFILFGMYGRFDKNINYRNTKFRRLIKWLADYAEIGLHPSYHTVENPQLLQKELENLEDLLKTQITRSRQHFLRLNLPDTYQNLIENDIIDDYTMGFAALPGFRAGICDTYRFYDLELDVETKLRLHPFAVMDGTLRDYLQLTPRDAIEKIRRLIKEVKKVNGTFISLWHNESLSDQKRWKGWRQVYEALLEEVSIEEK